MRNGTINKRLVVIIGVVILGLIAVVLSLLLAPKKTAEQAKVSEEIPENTPAVVINSAGLYSFLDNDTMYKNLRQDITMVARNFFKNNTKVIRFTISAQNNNSFSGAYDFAPDDLVVFSIKKLPNDRLKIDAVINNQNASDSFESNSKRNQYIATLPIVNDKYSIDYSSKSDTFLIIYPRESLSNLEIAKSDLAKNLGVDNLDNEKISATYPPNEDTIDYSDEYESYE